MRQTLLRIRLDSYFSVEPIEGITAIGIGWLGLIVLPLFVWWFARNRKAAFAGDSDAFLTALLGGGLCGFILLSPALFGPPAPGTLEAAKEYVPAFIPLYGYGGMLFIGFIAAAWWAGTRSRAVGLPTEVIWDSCMWLFFGGILGARLWYLIQKHEQVFANTKTLQQVLFKIVYLPDGGLVLYGGIVVGSLLYALYCWRKQVDGLLVGDVLIPSFFVGLGFGRLGCFMNGCCYGDTCHLPWAVQFPAGSVPFESLVARGIIPPDAAASLALHPTQLYSALNAFLLAALYHAYFRFRPTNGSVIALALLTYPITRFVIEFLRADETGQLNTSLTISQLGSIGLFTAGVLLQLWLTYRGRLTRPNGTVAT